LANVERRLRQIFIF